MGLIQSSIPPTPKDTSLKGKIVIVTGGNTGLGLEAARQYLVLGASHVIIACRSMQKGIEAVVELRADAEVHKSNPSATVEAWDLDLDDYKSAVAFCQKVKAELKELDLLLCNGGVSILDYQESKSGHDRVMQVNCYSHFLICLELLPLLRQTASLRGVPTRLTFTGSRAHVWHRLAKNPPSPEGTVMGFFDARQEHRGLFRYSDSKLALHAFVTELASRVSSDEIIINDVCPGFVQTGIDRNFPWLFEKIVVMLRWLLARDVQAGARTMVYASAVAGPETHGKFLSSNESNLGAPWLTEPAGRDFRRKLWAETVDDVSRYDPELKTYATLAAVCL